MHPSALGIKSTIKAITSQQLIRELFAKHAPSLAIQENATGDQLFGCLAQLRTTHPQEYDSLANVLHEIGQLSPSRNSPDRLIHALEQAGLLDRIKGELPRDLLISQNLSVWTILHAPAIWSRVVLQYRCERLPAQSWEEYTPKDHFILPKADLPTLQQTIADYLVTETMHGEHVHVEIEDEPYCDRYFFSVNNFPSHVQQFDPHGVYGINRDRNAINFIIEYHRKSEIIRIKSNLDAARRRGIVRVFARSVLNSDVAEKRKTVLDLSDHLKEKIVPPPVRREIVSVRRTGIRVQFYNRCGTIDSCHLTTEGPSNLNERMRACLTAFGVPLSEVEVVEVCYRLEIYDKANSSKTVNACIRTDGFHVSTRDAETREIVMSYLKRVVS